MCNSSNHFVDDFQWAVVRLATFGICSDEPSRLLFATATFLPSDRPLPAKMDGIDCCKVGKNGEKIFFRRTILRAQVAIDWYRSLETDQRTPVPSREEDVEEKYDRQQIAVSDLEDDPLWPNLGLPIMGTDLFSLSSKNNDPAPFIGSTPSRIHRRFGNADGFEAVLSNEKAVAFVARRLHIDLKEYPEYLGSVVLVVPDPIIKQVDNFLIPANGSQGERIHYRFVPRAGQSIDGLKITMFDERLNLLSSFESVNIPSDGILDIEKGNCTGRYGYVVTHPVHGILLYHPPSGFLRSIGFNIGIVNQVRKVSVPLGESSKSPVAEYTVGRTSRDQGGLVGEKAAQSNVNGRVASATRNREKSIVAERYDQRWFGYGMRKEAMEFIRGLVGRARNRVLIADPYFGVLQVPQTLLSISSGDVEINILTSKLAFETNFNDADDTEEPSSSFRANHVNKLNDFNKHIEQIRDVGNPKVVVKVLPGKKPKLHDRFLVVDNNIWFLGNSLNTLGDRSSMIIKLPNPDEVLVELEDMLSAADDFDSYYKHRTELIEGKEE